MNEEDLGLLYDFIHESNDHFQNIDVAMSDLANDYSSKHAINEIFRGVHTIKGVAGFLNLTSIKELSHLIETGFDYIRNNTITLSPSIYHKLYEGLDMLQSLANDLEKALLSFNSDKDLLEYCKVTNPVKVLLSHLKQIISGDYKDDIARSDNNKYNKSDFLKFKDAEVYILKELRPSLYVAGEHDKQFIENLTIIEDLLKKWELSDLYDDFNILKEVVDSLKDGSIPERSLGAMMDVGKDSIIGVGKVVDKYYEEFLRKEVTFEIQQKADINTPEPIYKIQSMRVNQNLMDDYIELVGELLVYQSSFLNLEKNIINDNLGILELNELIKEHSKTIGEISEKLQKNVIKMRCIKSKSIFQKYNKMVREITRKNGKKVDLKLKGVDIEIDKSIAEKIADPIVHILRNSLDHGIESEERREKIGKNKVATIILSAEINDNIINIKIEDDGGGIDPSKIAKIAIEKGIITKEECSLLDNKSIINLIFKPGFSTAEEITDISGRGVGMDVVLTNIKNMNGTIDVCSEIDKGTVITMSIPAIAAITLNDSVIVKEKDSVYAIPIKDIQETLKLSGKKIKTFFNKNKGFLLRDEFINIKRLSDIFSLEKDELIDNNKDFYLLILCTRKGKLALIVDKILKKDKIVIKSIDKSLQLSQCFVGTSILDDNSVILVLEPAELIEMSKNKDI